jgi:hypothetical protein
MGKGSELWRCALVQRCGTTMDTILCLAALVLTRDPLGKRPRHPPSFLLTSARRQNRSSATRMKRWSLEVTFEEGRAHVGIETQRQWSDLASERSTPLLFGLYSLVTLGWRKHYTRMGRFLSRVSAWYCKHTATFRDVLALVRRQLWGQGTFPTSPTDPSVVLVPRSTLERWSLAVC